MTKLSKRIKKGEKLEFVDIPGAKTTTAGFTGSKGDRYQISLYQKKGTEKIQIADETINTIVISVCCQWINTGNGKLNPMDACKGNCHHTVCYHGLCFIKETLKKKGKSITRHETALSALNGLNFGGQLAKVISKQGNGYVWAVIS